LLRVYIPPARGQRRPPDKNHERHQQRPSPARTCDKIAFTKPLAAQTDGCAFANPFNSLREMLMKELTEDEQRRILEAPPRGTWAVILVIGIAMLLSWLYFFFGLFMSHGPVA